MHCFQCPCIAFSVVALLSVFLIKLYINHIYGLHVKDVNDKINYFALISVILHSINKKWKIDMWKMLRDKHEKMTGKEEKG